MKCPNCGVNLLMTDRNGVEIDYCPDCRGIWLDRGELDKIIERANQSQPPFYPKSEKPFHKDTYSDHRPHDYKKKKKDSFLEDLFDF